MSEEKLGKIIDKYIGWFMNKLLSHLKTILIAGGILVVIEQIYMFLASYLSKWTGGKPNEKTGKYAQS